MMKNNTKRENQALEDTSFTLSYEDKKAVNYAFIVLSLC
jgi:hypothetical protein